MSLDLDVEASLSIGGVHDAVHGALNKHHKERAKPLYLRRTFSAIGDGTHNVILDVGSPPNGRMWKVTGVTLYGSDDHTVVAAVLGGLYTGNPGNLSISQLVIPALAFPSYTNISDKTFWVHSNENLCVQTSAPGVAGQQYGCNFFVQEWRDHEISQKSGR